MDVKESSSQEQLWLILFKNYRLSPFQKKIIALGIDGREISSQDIYHAISTQDPSVYDREVSALRNKEVLIEIRSAGVARRLGRKIKQPIQTIPRFKVKAPEKREMKSFVCSPSTTRIKSGMQNHSQIHL